MLLSKAPDLTRADPADEMHSRSVLAGYDPQRLAAARVAVVGLGALGQNVVQNLALSGVGGLLLIDDDVFEEHNRTRSPLYPDATDRRRHGLAKAPTVAARARRCSTAADPSITYLREIVQVCGDGPIRWADVVVSAVDGVGARAWLARRCRIHGTPVVEAGFAGPDYNLSAFSGADDEPCYRCFNPAQESSGSCTQYARDAEHAMIIPAIQSTAAVTGGLVAEQVIRVLHGDTDMFGLRVFGDVRAMSATATRLRVRDGCDEHAVLPVLGTLEGVPRTVGGLVRALRAVVPGGQAWLAERVVVRESCTGCRSTCVVRATEAAWMRAPRCLACGGPWTLADVASPDGFVDLALDGPLPRGRATVPTRRLGLRAGGAVKVVTADGAAGLVLLRDRGLVSE